MAELEAEVFVTGAWKNYEELEEELSLIELVHTVSAMRNRDYENKKFTAALKGIDLDENKDSDPIANARKLNNAKKVGPHVSPDDVIANPTFTDNGIGHEVI